MRILVLMGGNSPERMVSLVSGEAVAEGLSQNGHRVFKMDPAEPDRMCSSGEKIYQGQIGEIPQGANAPLTIDKIRTLLKAIKDHSIKLVFPVLHGGWGEDGRLQALLELANIPFAGSGSVASALAMNKLQAKRIVSYVNVPTPDYKYIPQIDQDQALKICRDFGFPLVVKPNNGGSTVGVTIVGSEAELSSAIEQVANLEDDLLIERYIAGREITVGILDDKGLSVVEIAPKDGFYDYKHKYTGGQSDYICPAEISAEATKKCLSYAEQAFNILGCRVFGRVDFRMREDGRIFFLEVNTIPGMTAHSLVPKSASAVGINFNQLVEQIVQLSKNIKR